MATQFAINEPDSFNSPNVTYLLSPRQPARIFGLLQTPDDVVFGYGAIDFIGDHDYFDISLPSSIINSFGERAFFGTVTINVIANDGTPFDGVLTLYAGKSSTVVATGTSLGSGETFLQFDGGSTYSCLHAGPPGQRQRPDRRLYHLRERRPRISLCADRRQRRRHGKQQP